METIRDLSTDPLYAGVPEQHVQELAQFRAAHPIQSRQIDGVAWRFIRAGQGPAAVLVLGGAMSTAESSRSIVTLLERDYRVLSPSYPVYPRMSDFLDGLAKLLEAEGMERVHVYGHSLGAGIGHALVRRCPERVDRLVLSSFGLYNERNLRHLKRAVRLFGIMPYSFVTGYYKRRMDALLSDADPDEKGFYLAYMNDVLNRQLNKKLLMGQFRLLGDLFEHPEAYRLYEPVRDRDVLILQAKDDTGFDPDEQAALRRAYPETRVHVFEKGGHLARTTNREEFDDVLCRFLAGQPVHN